MTFKQFEQTVLHFRKDVIVSKHGDFCTNKSNNTLGVVFISNNKQSKVYDFSGTYEEILHKLDIKEFHTNDDILHYTREIERLEKDNGTKSFFSSKLVDNSMKINEYKAILESFNSEYRIV